MQPLPRRGDGVTTVTDAFEWLDGKRRWHVPYDEVGQGPPCLAPLLVAMGAGTPPRSLAEMQALAALPGVQSVTLPGSLAFYDERPEETAAAVAPFLGPE